MQWVWQGHEKLDRDVMEEDILGRFERTLKDRDPVAAHKLEVGDDGTVGRIWKQVHPKTI
jgi:hypothetical protein